NRVQGAGVGAPEFRAGWRWWGRRCGSRPVEPVEVVFRTSLVRFRAERALGDAHALDDCAVCRDGAVAVVTAYGAGVRLCAAPPVVSSGNPGHKGSVLVE